MEYNTSLSVRNTSRVGVVNKRALFSCPLCTSRDDFYSAAYHPPSTFSPQHLANFFCEVHERGLASCTSNNVRKSSLRGLFPRLAAPWQLVKPRLHYEHRKFAPETNVSVVPVSGYSQLFSDDFVLPSLHDRLTPIIRWYDVFTATGVSTGHLHRA